MAIEMQDINDDVLGFSEIARPFTTAGAPRSWLAINAHLAMA
jgi:hypothetical protein